MAETSLKLFVNYRRADHRDFVEHMRTWFMIRYGRENVFMDFDTIPPFARFEDFIRQKVRECDVVISIIGPRWLELLQEKEAAGKPDYVRIELEEALQHGKLIAPVCIQGARVPAEELIPAPLHPIFARNIPELQSGRDILNNIQWIMDALEARLAEQGVEHVAPVQPVESVQAATRGTAFNVREAIKHFFEARDAGDLPTALGWLAQIRESRAAIPDFFELEQREAEIRAKLKAEEEQRRRLEAAEYLYDFVRLMVEYREPQTKIRAALEQVWGVYAKYDPDRFEAIVFQDVQAPPTPAKLAPPSAKRGKVLDILPQPFEWIEIPAGTVILEDASSRNPPGTKGGSYPVAAFSIAKYPVTNAQYTKFVSAKDGYADARWWEYSEEAKKWRQANAKPEDTAFAGDELPRTNVNWYDAVAFCRWLSAKAGETIMLPTEQQWQWAAQANPDGETRWKYPWGDEFDAKRCNFNTNGPTPVRKFPNGASPYGVMDMSGNVWEWCLTEYGTGDVYITGNKTRVLRGGSWSLNQDNLRAPFRSRFVPDDGLDDIGFRCARS